MLHGRRRMANMGRKASAISKAFDTHRISRACHTAKIAAWRHRLPVLFRSTINLFQSVSPFKRIRHDLLFNLGDRYLNIDRRGRPSGPIRVLRVTYKLAILTDDHKSDGLPTNQLSGGRHSQMQGLVEKVSSQTTIECNLIL